MYKTIDIIQYFKDKGQPLIDALLVFVVGWYLAKLLLYVIIRMIKKSSVDPIVVSFIKSILDIVFKVLVIVTAIAQLGVNTTSLVTVLATGGAAIVLGLKDSMTGVVSGIIILFTKPFTKGDIIEVKKHKAPQIIVMPVNCFYAFNDAQSKSFTNTEPAFCQLQYHN